MISQSNCIANYRSKCLGPDAFSASPRCEGHLSLRNTLASQPGSPSLALQPDRKRPARTFGASQGQLLLEVCRVQTSFVGTSMLRCHSHINFDLCIAMLLTDQF